MTIIEKETVMQVDFPFELRYQLLKTKIDHIDAGWLTHAHSDHLSGIDDIRMVAFSNKNSLPFFVNEETLAIVRRRFPYLFEQNNCYRHFFPHAFLEPRIIGSEPIEFKDLKILPIRNVHGEDAVSSFRIGDFALLADISSIESSELDKLKGLKVLAISTTVHKKNPKHLTLDEVLDLIKYLAPQKAYLTHMNHTFDYEETLQHLPQGVVPAVDGLKITV